jgi:hypothetical protein
MVAHMKKPIRNRANTQVCPLYLENMIKMEDLIKKN